jgi:hypothetical protein
MNAGSSSMSGEKEILDLPHDVHELMRRRQAMAESIVAQGGPLDQHLRRMGADPENALVYLFGSSATGRSYKDANRFLSVVSDLDLLVFALKPDGHPWRTEGRPEPVFYYQGVRVEVISGWVECYVDGGITEELGIGPVHYQAAYDIPKEAVLLRKPEKPR